MKTMLCILLSLCLLSGKSTDQTNAWQLLAPGLELRYLSAKKKSAFGDSRITVLRADPARWELVFAGISQTREASGHSVREWAKSQKLIAAINAGMFAPDYKTHSGYLKYREHTNSSQLNAYQSVAAFDPKRPGIPPFRLFDLDEPGQQLPAILNDYSSAIQNLRLLKKPGVSRWGQSKRKWSEAALGEDNSGHILFIFSRSPFSMHDINAELLAGGIGIAAAQHLEGGPEAQLYLELGATRIDQCGSFETGFREDNDNHEAWAVPNVLGLRQKKAEQAAPK